VFMVSFEMLSGLNIVRNANCAAFLNLAVYEETTI
jgi:hypothetical protein